jgi:2-polyprenyl-6-methoxyphenol hydroxylase-like FAD-dependent oxidoreductase
LTPRYLAGCDGAHSRVRDTAGIPFPGPTCPEVNRPAQVTLPDSVIGEPAGTAAPGLREALSYWFGPSGEYPVYQAAVKRT